MTLSEAKISSIKYKVIEILIRAARGSAGRKGQLMSAKNITDEMREFNVSPPQLSQFIRTYMVGEEFDEFIFVKRGGDYGLVHKSSLEDDQKAFWFGRA